MSELSDGGIVVNEHRNDSEWADVFEGLERAVNWLQANKSYLSTFGVVVGPPWKPGLTIDFGYLVEDQPRHQGIQKLFAGKRAKLKRLSNNELAFSLLDSGLEFRWTVFRFETTPAEKTEEVTL